MTGNETAKIRTSTSRSVRHLFAVRRLTGFLAAAPGGERWLRLARRFLPRPEEPILVEDFDDELMIVLRLNEHMQSVIFWAGVYNRELVQLLNRILRPGMTVIDIGANIGEITLIAAKRVGSTGLVISYEPISEIADQLSANVAANGFKNVTIRKVALSEKVGSADVYRSPEPTKDGSINDGLGSLYIGNRDRVAAGSIPVSTLDLQVAELSLAKVDVIKMDIEGAELPALRGAEMVLRKHHPMLIVEVLEETAMAAGYRTADLFKFLADCGYRYEVICENGATRKLDPLKPEKFHNVFCVPSKDGDFG